MSDRYGLQEIVIDREALARFDHCMEPARRAGNGSITPQWMLDGASFWYADGAPDHTVICRVDGATGSSSPLFDVANTRRAFSELLGRDLPGEGLPFDTVVELDHRRFQVCSDGTSYVLTIDSGAIGIVKADAAPSSAAVPQHYWRPQWLSEPVPTPAAPSPDQCWFASVESGNISLRAAAGGSVLSITTDGTPDCAWEIQSRRSQSALPLTLGQRQLDPWSPDGCQLFALRVDRREVPELPFVRYAAREPQLGSIKMQRAGGAIDIAQPHVIDVASRRARRLDVGDTQDYYFVLMSWLPDGSGVLFSRHSRDFKTVTVLKADVLDGSVRVLLTESADTFVAIQHEVIYNFDNHAALWPDGSRLIWRSARSGWNHFYVYALDGRFIRPLTQGEFPVIDVLAIDPVGGWVYFTAHHDQARPYDTHLCRVNVHDDAIERLTRLDGQNIVHISPATKTFVAINSRTDRPFRTDLYTCEGKHLATLRHAIVDDAEATGGVTAEEFKVKAADGETELWGVMYKPADFDAGKKYPIVDHLYAAPVTAVAPHHFDLGHTTQSRLDRALAQLGYIVINVDARGTPERSKPFLDVVYGKWGRHEIEDHVATIKQLAQRHAFIDLDRVGVWGYSWGGYFAIRAMMQAADFFRVGVAAAPVADPHDAMLYEPYLDLPARAAAAYEHATLYPRARDIVGKLMLIAGSADPLVYASTLKMVRALIDTHVEHEFVVLTDAGHVLQGADDAYFVRKLVTHFERHLKPIDAAKSRVSIDRTADARKVPKSGAQGEMIDVVRQQSAHDLNAARILSKAITCDLHGCMPLRAGDESFLPQLERYREVGVKFVSINIGWDATPLEEHIRMLAHFRSWLRKYPDRYALVTDVASVESAAASGKLAVAFDVEGMNGVGDQCAMIDVYYHLGVRCMLLAYNKNNRVGGGCQDQDTGLTAYGRDVVRAMERTGMILCCSHAGRRTALEAIDLSANPVIFSHSNPSAVHRHDRNVDDELISACARRGGLIGINGIGLFLGENDASTATYVRHIDHVVQLVGPEHVGIGLDYVFDTAELDALIRTYPEMYPPERYSGGISQVSPEQLPQIVAALLQLGYPAAAIKDILGGNFLRIARTVWR